MYYQMEDNPHSSHHHHHPFPHPHGHPEEHTQPLFEFSSEFSSPNLEISGRSKLNVSNPSEFYSYCLLIPSLESKRQPTQRHNFKIIKSKGKHIGIGICHKESAAKSQFTSTADQIQGYFVMADSGNLYSCSEKQVKGGAGVKSDLTGIDVDDIVQVIYEPLEKRVTLFNETKNQSASTTLVFEDLNRHHLCVIMRDEGDEVEYLGQEGEDIK